MIIWLHRFCSFEGANENVWHVLVRRHFAYLVLHANSLLNFILKEVEPNSPAALAGLKSDYDYIIGSDTPMQEVCNNIFWPLYSYCQYIDYPFSFTFSSFPSVWRFVRADRMSRGAPSETVRLQHRDWQVQGSDHHAQQ